MKISLIIIILVGSLSIFKQIMELIKWIKLKENKKIKATCFFILIILILMSILVYMVYQN